jgi:hypothetical protein
MKPTLLTLLLLISTIGCRATPIRTLPRMDVLSLSGRSPAGVDALLGKPFDVDRRMPDETRTYLFAGDRHVMVGLFGGKVSDVVFGLGDTPASSAAEALALVGLNEGDLSLTFETPAGSRGGVRRYKGSVRGIPLKQVGASYLDDEYVMVVVKFANVSPTLPWNR